MKLAAPFFVAVKVNDLPAVTKEQLSIFIDWVDASRTIDAMDQAWPVNVVMPDVDTLDEKLQWHLTEVAQQPNTPAIVNELLTAVRDRDVDAYAAAQTRLDQLRRVAQAVADRNRIRGDLDRSAPVLADEIATNPSAAKWDSRLADYAEAWQWEMTGRWILAQDSEDANALKVSLNAIEQQIRSEVERLAAERAWGHAVAPDRITGAGEPHPVRPAGVSTG